jgi:Tol biopolymer transport system component/tRNA A-37 threonylcarbamoyl transferase component Bud32
MTLKNGYLLRDRYRILDILGQGAIGVIYRAVDEKLDISVVIKERAYRSEDDAQHFQRGARVLASLRHPNIARVYNYFLIEGQGLYLVGEYIEGQDLRQWLSEAGELTEMEALQVGIAICNALIYLHSQDPPILHNGIAPKNIKISPFDEIMLLDLGIDDDYLQSQCKSTSTQVKNHRFIAPECFSDEGLDQRSDIFSLGGTLYTALGGYPPENSRERALGKAQLSPLLGYQPGLTRLTVKAVKTALNLRCEDRWQSAAEMKAALITARNALPADKQKDTRLTSLDQMSTSASSSRKELKKQGASLIDRIKSKKPFSKRDPGRYIFATVIVVLGALLGFTLLRPQGLHGLITIDPQPTTMQIDVDHQNEMVALPLPTAEPIIVNTVAPPNEEIILTETEPGFDPAPTSIGGGARLLAFVSERSGIPQIWLIDVSSKETTQLTDLDDGACQPDWSPSGEHIVFTSPCMSKRASNPGSRLMIIDIASGEIHSLPPSLEGDFDPAWSPDGEWIAYTTLINKREQLAKININELKPLRLSDGSYRDSSPAWSPDGTQLAFVRNRGVDQIWLMDPNGKNQVQFTRSGRIDNTNPTWYYDGSLILFSQSFGEGSASKQIYGMRVEDIGHALENNIIPMMKLDYIPLMDHVDVSPDGYWLAFEYWYFNILEDIYVMSFPSANLIQLTDHPGPDYHPVWSP